VTRRILACLCAASLLAVPAGTGPAVAQSEEPDFAYSIKEARAYAVRAALRREVIELLPECDPEEDEYDCDNSRYNHEKNCPTDLRIGPRGRAPAPREPAEAQPFEGGAGEGSGPDERPRYGSPIQLNRLLSWGKMSHLTGILEAGGLASSMFVDLSGRVEPEAHTTSEAFSNLADYEERCFPENADGDVDENNHEHFVSRSGEGPNTYHLAECIGRRCNFGLGFNAERARTIVQLQERDGKVIGRLRAMVEGLTFGDGQLRVDWITTYGHFQSDGTRQGLRWQVTTTASGARIGDRRVALPPGGTAEGPGFTVGVSEPYVSVPSDGGELTIVAPGLHFGSDEQNAFMGGIEVVASFREGDPFAFDPALPPEVGEDMPDFADGGFASVGGDGAAGLDIGDGMEGLETELTDEPLATGDDGAILIYELATGRGLIPGLVLLALLLWMFIMSYWIQRFAWGRRLARRPPFSTMDWIYRAFVKT
jgi:hypothetical protein